MLAIYKRELKSYFLFHDRVRIYCVSGDVYGNLFYWHTI